MANAKRVIYETSVIPKESSSNSSATYYRLDDTINKKSGGKGIVEVNSVQGSFTSVHYPVDNETDGMDAKWDESDALFNESIEITDTDFTLRTDGVPCDFLYVKNLGTEECQIALENDEWDILVPPEASVAMRLNRVDADDIQIQTAGDPTTIEYVLSRSGFGAQSPYSIDFNAIVAPTDCINLGTWNNIGNGQFTISAWIKRDRTGVAETIFDNDDTSKELGFDITAGNKLHLYLKNGGTTGAVTGNTNLNADTWYHVAATRDGSNECKLYVNTTEQSSTPTHNIDASGTGPIIGAYNTSGGLGGVSNPFDGKITEVSIFNVAKTQSEINDIYNSGTPTNLSEETGLIGYWRMGEGSGTLITDDSTSFKNGTLTNGPTWSSEVP